LENIPGKHFLERRRREWKNNTELDPKEIHFGDGD
jgi:hypothetical protein